LRCKAKATLAHAEEAAERGALPFNSLFEMQDEEFRRLAKWVAIMPFNSLFEMPWAVFDGVDTLYIHFQFSI